MQGSYASLRSSGLLFDHCNPMELQQDDSYFKQPLQLGEQFEYMDTQTQYYEAPQGVVDQEFIARSARIHTDASAPLLGLGLSTSLFQNNGFRDNWRYHEAMEGQQHSVGLGLQPSPAQCLSQGFAYSTQPAYDESYKIADCSDVEACKEDMTSSSTSPKMQSSPAMDVWPLVPEDGNPSFCSDNGMLTKDVQDDEEGPGDKPYARLIHEALMQAPGHRMMLREIYDWFVQNTTKPSESGTNGWQNSIRHNLSMNQAFENDRTDPANPGQQARKANSVWILTDDAIRHGVQSTTRYRKHGSNKKTNRTRTPAPLRQRSGAKGGRAARRAARLRREEQMHRQGCHSLQQNSTIQDFPRLRGTDRTSQEVDHFPVASPLTPENEPAFAFSQSIDNNTSYYYHLPDFYDLKSEPLPARVEAPYQGDLQQETADSCMKATLSYP